MKTTNLFVLLLVVLLSSCTAAYRTGQTPDDVYYSPARPEEEYVRAQREESRRYRYAEEDYEDRYLRMKVRNRNQWNDLNDWYSYERWTLGSNSYFAPTVNPFVSWNYFYNPYYSYYNPYFAHWAVATAVTKPITTGPRTFNLNTYQQTPVNIKSTRAQSGQYAPANYSTPTSRSSSSNRGNSLREIFSNSGGSYTTPGSSSSGGSNSPSSSGGSSSGSSSSGSSAPVRRF
jgi:hypothetical protein